MTFGAGAKLGQPVTVPFDLKVSQPPWIGPDSNTYQLRDCTFRFTYAVQGGGASGALNLTAAQIVGPDGNTITYTVTQTTVNQLGLSGKTVTYKLEVTTPYGLTAVLQQNVIVLP